MLFIHPMWAEEVERIGMQRCTPTGYAFRVIADLVGIAGLVSLFVVPAVFIAQWIKGGSVASPIMMIATPFGLGIVSEVIYRTSTWLARRKGFRYEYDLREASWFEAGERRTIKWPL